ncbi:MAG: hypothetical protein KatS3mg068_2660 [Candidatus Sericytochromatia bacterium]|nr:MAG: hypothetical protein KatS3mg068_2660 [Candidatus Sericytochromatia bacterium]
MNIDNIFKNMQEKHYYESLDLEVSESIYEIINEYLNRITYIQYDYANIINKTLHKIIIIIDNKYQS